MRCETCGHIARGDERFCSNCGAAVATGDRTAPPPAADAPDDSWIALADTAAAVPSAVGPAAKPFAVPPPIERSPPDFDQSPAPRRSSARILWAAVILVGLLGAAAIVAWTSNWTRSPATAQLDDRVASDDPAPPGVADWQRAYRDTFVDEDEVTLATSADARQRNFPTTDGTIVQRTIPAATSLTGRWVRGRDPSTKWLRLAGGGDVWEGNLSAPGGSGSPIAIPFTNANEDFGPEIEAYLERVRAQSRAEFERIERLPKEEREAAMNDLEGRSVWLRIPDRRWRGLTVTAVAQHYEAHGIYFAESPATVRRALIAAGIDVDSDGGIPLTNEDAISCGIGPTSGDEAARYGATQFTCGV